MTGHFLVGGKPKLPLIYTVDTIREGKNYCTRYVQVRQPSLAQQDRPLDAEVIFIAVVSFKTAEPRGLESQVPPPADLKGWISNPKKCDIAPAVDVPSWIEYMKRKGMKEQYTAVDLRKVDVEEENKSKPLHEHRKTDRFVPSRRGVSFEYMRTCGNYNLFLTPPTPRYRKSSNLKFKTKYASDRNGMFAITGPHNVSDNILHTGSLSHTIIFHANPTKLLFKSTEDPDTDPSAWTVVEQFGESASEGRGMIRSRLWSSDGTLLASVMQDALIRVRMDDDDENSWSGKISRRQMTFKEQLRNSKL
ncbi:hypothetical protein AA313_de0202144 [Arthrobotrys entomopaga]|nr:hypothetical protein AA313_de0202144 [Arthrobotrys entomopaga]